MKYLTVALFMLLAACTLQPITDMRSPAEASATRTARPLPPLYEPVLRIVLERPPVDIAPAVAPNEASLLPTVTPTKASE